jgi:hypothetical protein
MKKIIAIILTVCSILSFAACGGDSYAKYDADVKYNFTGLNSEKIYDTVAAVSMNPQDYTGGTVAISVPFSVMYNFATNSIEKTGIYALDPTQCCNAFYELKLSDGTNHLPIGEVATFIGTFNNGYIDVSEVVRHEEKSVSYDIDTLDFSAYELKNFLVNYQNNYSTSEYKDKTIRIFGHYPNTDGYQFILGLDSSGSSVWDIEIITDLALPKQISNLVNGLEIIGVLTTYTEGGVEYPCIKVTSFSQVAGIF